jgi:hypothetical protein
MLSFGAAALTLEAGVISTFSANLERLDGAVRDPATMEFWAKNPEAWKACRKDPQPILHTMEKFHAWIKALPGKPQFIAYPATFDHPFIHHYLVRFCGDNPMGFAGFDVRSYFAGMRGKSLMKSKKSDMPKRWLPKDMSHTHIAVEDAIEQGLIFTNMMRENLLNPDERVAALEAEVIRLEGLLETTMFSGGK